jgi:DNA polymerase III delta subunit
MIRLYPEQLRAQLNEGLRAAYLLLGNDPLLLQESLDAVRHAAPLRALMNTTPSSWITTPTGMPSSRSARR